jgi:hypothetical protein
MKSSAQTSALERLGHMLGRGWWTYVRQAQKVNGWLVAHGVPAGIAKAALLALKLIVFGALLYTVFWPALLLVCAAVAVWIVQSGTLDEEFEWLFTDQEELRKTPGYDPVLYNDVSHPDYVDEKND